jgi:hypothetical protein
MGNPADKKLYEERKEIMDFRHPFYTAIPLFKEKINEEWYLTFHCMVCACKMACGSSKWIFDGSRSDWILGVARAKFCSMECYTKIGSGSLNVVELELCAIKGCSKEALKDGLCKEHTWLNE